MTDYFIADTHFGHRNILEISKRPFRCLAEFHSSVCQNWNNTVRDRDRVYMLGDMFYNADNDEAEEILKQLKGKIILIVGNHDRWWMKEKRLLKYFHEIHHLLQITTKVEGNKYVDVILCHYPMLEWNHYFRNSYHIFGHIHNTLNEPQTQYIRNQPRMLNAGVDINGFKPVTLVELIENNDRFYRNESINP